MRGVRKETFEKIVAAQSGSPAEADSQGEKSTGRHASLCACGKPLRSYPRGVCEDCWVQLHHFRWMIDRLNWHRAR